MAYFTQVDTDQALSRYSFAMTYFTQVDTRLHTRDLLAERVFIISKIRFYVCVKFNILFLTLNLFCIHLSRPSTLE